MVCFIRQWAHNEPASFATCKKKKERGILKKKKPLCALYHMLHHEHLQAKKHCFYVLYFRHTVKTSFFLSGTKAIYSREKGWGCISWDFGIMQWELKEIAFAPSRDASNEVTSISIIINFDCRDFGRDPKSWEFDKFVSYYSSLLNNNNYNNI